MKKPLTVRLLVFWLSLAVLLTGLYPGCARNPVTGKRQVALISEQQEIAMGRESHPQILQQYGRLENAQIQTYVEGIGQRLAGVSHRPELEWHFTVVDVPVVNAFAVPGGYIYITREIMAYMNNEAELAGVLGHEIGHVTARHSVEQISKAQLFSLGLGVGSIISPTFQQLGGLAESGLGLLFLKYGRDDERQSDQLGVNYMLQAGYDPRRMVEFFEVFERLQEESGEVLPNWLSTHPAPPDRIKRTSEEASQLLANRPSTDLKVAREPYLRQIAGIVYGENPREGFTQDGWFLHPDLRFRIRFPNGWRVQNTRSAVVAVEPNGAAAIQLTLATERRSPEEYAALLANQPGVRLVSGNRTSINGNPSFLGIYEVVNQNTQQAIGALAAFISYGNNLYQVVGITSPNQFRSASNIFESSLTTFGALTDNRALGVQPDRIRIVEAREGQTLRDLAGRFSNSRIKLEDLALLNRLEPNEPLRAGVEVKLIEPGRRLAE
ncbi:MAG: peptidase M48 [Acidobacteria bacterium]|nr:MAG: peptidase M48 [Acidobacteriota bacterium]